MNSFRAVAGTATKPLCFWLVKPQIWICILLIGCQACSPRGADCESAEFRAHMADLDATAGAPFADQYFTIFRKPIDSCEAKYRRAMYIDSFFDGYRASGGLILGAPSAELRAMQAGMRAGADYRRAQPQSVIATYASFGYTAISTEGVWSTRFEHSDFVPIEGYEGETWWADVLPELGRKYPDGFLPSSPVRIRIKGYLSRKGQRAHFGAYARELYVEQATILGPAQQGVAADRRENASSAER